MGYLFDTNIFITSKNQLPYDVWPTFWRHIAELIRNGRIFSSEKVREEIERGNDEIDYLDERKLDDNVLYSS